MQFCMDSSDWIKGIVQDDGAMDPSSPPTGELIACSRPPVPERRLRPQHDQALKCPRCDSTHTKFCYYNNYSLSQPRYFCKTCRRYWTKGGSLRNVPVGGGCRKNKRSSAKKPSQPPEPPGLSFQDSTTSLHLSSFSGVQVPHISSLADTTRNLNFMECKHNSMLENAIGGLDLVDTRFAAMLGASRSQIFMDGGDFGPGDMGNHGFMSSTASLHGMNMLGFSIDGNHAALMEACQRLTLPLEVNEDPNAAEAKPGTGILSLEWQEQCCADVGRSESMGYSGGLGSWSGMIDGHGHSTAI